MPLIADVNVVGVQSPFCKILFPWKACGRVSPFPNSLTAGRKLLRIYAIPSSEREPLCARLGVFSHKLIQWLSIYMSQKIENEELVYSDCYFQTRILPNCRALMFNKTTNTQFGERSRKSDVVIPKIAREMKVVCWLVVFCCFVIRNVIS